MAEAVAKPIQFEQTTVFNGIDLKMLITVALDVRDALNFTMANVPASVPKLTEVRDKLDLALAAAPSTNT